MKYLLIGCTGSLGQGILFHLLTKTTHTLFVAIREKTLSIDERIRELCQAIHLDYAKYSTRIQTIPCVYDDQRCPILAEKDKTHILEQVDVFLNALADIHFTRDLYTATRNNCSTALSWMDLYNRSKATQYTYVSTAFTGFHRASSREARDRPYRIPEELHCIPEVGHTVDACEQTYSAILEKRIDDTDLYASVFENSYTYTKNLTELLLSRRIARGQLYIVRPSIIVSAVNSPYPGWGRFQTFHVFILGMITGRCIFSWMDYETAMLNTVPIDMVAGDCVRLVDKDYGEKRENIPYTILHSCLTYNSPEWAKDDMLIYSTFPEYIYLTYSKTPLQYSGKVYYPSRMTHFRSQSTCILSLLVLLVYRLVLNTSSYGIVRGVYETWAQLVFSWSYNQLFSPFVNKNCQFERKTYALDTAYCSVSHKDILTKFIQNVPELIVHQPFRWLSTS